MSGNMHNMNQKFSRWDSKNVLKCPSIDDDASSVTSSNSTYLPSRYHGSPAVSVSARLHSVLKEQLYTDVKFVLCYGKKPKPVLCAHKVVLASGSSKFAEMLFNEDGSMLSGMVEVQINNISEEAFTNIVEYLYTDDVYFTNDLEVMDTMQAAEKFEIQALVDRCGSFFETAEISAHNACSRFQLAVSHKLNALRDRCASFIQENTALVLGSDDFANCTPSTIRAICKMQALNLRSEAELVRGVMSWSKKQEHGSQSRREFLMPTLKTIRFLTMTSEEFQNLLRDHMDIFTDTEALNIVMYLADRSSKSLAQLPAWCSKGTNRCNASLLPTPAERQTNVSGDRVKISLRPTRGGFLPRLSCFVQIHCSWGRHRIDGVRLRFDNPVTPDSVIKRLVIRVTMEETNFSFAERLEIRDSTNVEVHFSRTFLIFAGNIATIRADATDVEKYKFLQYDDENSFRMPSPFVCTIGSEPKANRYFFISEILHSIQQKEPVRRRPPRRR